MSWCVSCIGHSRQPQSVSVVKRLRDHFNCIKLSSLTWAFETSPCGCQAAYACCTALRAASAVGTEQLLLLHMLRLKLVRCGLVDTTPLEQIQDSCKNSQHTLFHSNAQQCSHDMHPCGVGLLVKNVSAGDLNLHWSYSCKHCTSRVFAPFS